MPSNGGPAAGATGSGDQPSAAPTHRLPAVLAASTEVEQPGERLAAQVTVLGSSGGESGLAADEQDQPDPGRQQPTADGQQQWGMGAGERQGSRVRSVGFGAGHREGGAADRRPGRELVGTGPGWASADALQRVHGGWDRHRGAETTLAVVGDLPEVNGADGGVLAALEHEQRAGRGRPGVVAALALNGHLGADRAAVRGHGQGPRPTAEAAVVDDPGVGQVDDDPGWVGEFQDPEADPLGHSDPGGGLTLEGARGVDLPQGREVGAQPGRAQDWLVVLVVGGGAHHDLQEGGAAKPQRIPGAVQAHHRHVADGVIGGDGAVELEHDAVEAGVAAGPQTGQLGRADRWVLDHLGMGGEAGLGAGQAGGGVEDGGNEQGSGGGDKQPDQEPDNTHGDLLDGISLRCL